jgi:hypothetical protein
VSVEALKFVAAQVAVPAEPWMQYGLAGRSARYRQLQIRRHLGVRECFVDDAEKLTDWLAAAVCERKRRPERARDELMARCRTERIEPPIDGRRWFISGNRKSPTPLSIC